MKNKLSCVIDQSLIYFDQLVEKISDIVKLSIDVYE